MSDYIVQPNKQTPGFSREDCWGTSKFHHSQDWGGIERRVTRFWAGVVLRLHLPKSHHQAFDFSVIVMLIWFDLKYFIEHVIVIYMRPCLNELHKEYCVKTKVIALDWQWVTLRSGCQMNCNGHSSPVKHKVEGKPHKMFEKLKIMSEKSTLFVHFFVKYF